MPSIITHAMPAYLETPPMIDWEFDLPQQNNELDVLKLEAETTIFYHDTLAESE